MAPPNPLFEILRHEIANDGPISLSRFMELALMHPEHGYYSSQEPFGVRGDFVTAPEISQMFGEIIGLALGQAWLDQGKPSDFVLCELGPGRGTLMADILRVGARIPGFLEHASLWLVETSTRLRGIQAKTLTPHIPDINHAASLSALPELPLFLIANEFFDALPILQYQKKGRFLHEKRIGIAKGRQELAFGLGPAFLPDGQLKMEAERTEDHGIIEHSPKSEEICQQISTRLKNSGGCALIIDYGSQNGGGDTLQALQNGAFADPLAHPGKADLTAHVNFSALLRAATPIGSGFTSQGVWLERLGITKRAQILAKNSAIPDEIIAAHRRLTHPEEMGELFKVLGLWPEDAPPIAGFEP